MLHALEDLEPLFKFPIQVSVRKSWENYDKYIENLKQAYGEVRPQKFLGQSFAL